MTETIIGFTNQECADGDRVLVSVNGRYTTARIRNVRRDPSGRISSYEIDAIQVQERAMSTQPSEPQPEQGQPQNPVPAGEEPAPQGQPGGESIESGSDGE